MGKVVYKRRRNNETKENGVIEVLAFCTVVGLAAAAMKFAEFLHARKIARKDRDYFKGKYGGEK